MNAQKPRQIAVHALLEHAKGSDYIEDILDRHLAKENSKPKDRALSQELTYGVIRWKLTLDWFIARKTRRRPPRLAQILLRLGLYQLLMLDRVPDHAAVHETVEIAKELGLRVEAGFVNAILRAFAREKAAARLTLAQLQEREPALGFSHPQWLVNRWLKQWSAPDVIKLLRWDNTPPPTYARVNTLRTTPADLQEHWLKEEVVAQACPLDWVGTELIFRLRSHPPIFDLRTFSEGDFYIQDPSTLLAVTILNPCSGETILDLCAAPGGKTTFIAQLMQNRGRIFAEDWQPERLSLIRENCRRLGVNCVCTELSATMQAAANSSLFDRILVDAPCSNTGVLRRRVDLRWRLRMEEIERLCRSQDDLLSAASRRLKPGGTLVYSTCSLEPDENRAVAQRFLAAHADFRLDLDRELVPFRDEVDGAYVAKFVRTS